MLLILPRNLSAYIAFADADADSRVHIHHPIEVSLVGIFPDPTPLFNVPRQRKTIALFNIAMPRSSDQTLITRAQNISVSRTPT